MIAEPSTENSLVSPNLNELVVSKANFLFQIRNGKEFFICANPRIIYTDTFAKSVRFMEEVPPNATLQTLFHKVKPRVLKLMGEQVEMDEINDQVFLFAYMLYVLSLLKGRIAILLPRKNEIPINSFTYWALKFAEELKPAFQDRIIIVKDFFTEKLHPSEI